jgi:hypothetical protein
MIPCTRDDFLSHSIDLILVDALPPRDPHDDDDDEDEDEDEEDDEDEQPPVVREPNEE